jgi:hypothetical protein
MEFNLKITMNNAAFANNYEFELLRILENLPDRVAVATRGCIYDYNGNKVGWWMVE